MLFNTPVMRRGGSLYGSKQENRKNQYKAPNKPLFSTAARGSQGSIFRHYGSTFRQRPSERGTMHHVKVNLAEVGLTSSLIRVIVMIQTLTLRLNDAPRFLFFKRYL